MADALKIVRQEPIAKSAPLSIVSQAPIGQPDNLDVQGFQPMHMTSPSGEDVMVPHEQVGGKLQQGFKIGLPSQQSKLGEQVIPKPQDDTSAAFHANAPLSSLALGVASGAGIPESKTPVTDLLKSASGYEAHKKMLADAAVNLAKGNYVRGAAQMGAAFQPGLPQVAEMLTPSVEQGRQALDDFRHVISQPDKRETWAAAVNKAAPGKNPAAFTSDDWQRAVQIFNQDAKTQFHPASLISGLIHTGGMIPVAGPAAVGAGEEIGKGIENRNIDQILHGAGSGIGTVGALALGTKAGQNLAESAISKTVRPAVTAVKGAPTGAMARLLGGGTEAMAKTPIKQATAAGTATNAAVDAYAASKGIRLLPGQATGARGLKGIQSVGERAVVAPGALPDVLEGQKAAFGNLVDDFKSRVGHPEVADTESAGQNIKTQTQAKLDALKSEAQGDYQRFQNAAGDIPVDLSEVKAKAADALKSQAEALKNVPAKYSAPIRNVLTKLANLEPGGAVDPQVLRDYENAVNTYGLNQEQQAALRAKMGIPEGSGDGFKMSTAQQLRSAYLDIARDYSGNVPKSVQRYAVQAARDIDAAMTKAADSVGASEQWRQANAKWKQLQTVYNDPASPIYRILQEPSAIKVPGKILGKGTYGGDPSAVNLLKKQGIDIRPLKQEVVQQIAAKNFSLTNGGRGLGGYSMEFLGSLFDPAELDELTKMGRISRAIKFEMNPSGTSDVQAGERQLHGILARTSGAIVGPMASRFTTSEALARAARGYEPPPVTPLRQIFSGSVPPALPPGGSSGSPSSPGSPPPSPSGPGSPPSLPPPAGAPSGTPVQQMLGRRQNLDLRAAVDAMTPEERAKSIFYSDKADLPNARAFDYAEKQAKAPAVAMSDADGLKALNDKFGYDAGDALLKAKADALKESGLEAYHQKGDEFLYRGESPEELRSKLETARAILKNKIITVEMKDGRQLQFKGADFSYGTAKDLSAAESELKTHKAQREASGERARGELRGIAQVGPETGQENISPAAASGNGGNSGPVQPRSVNDILSGKPREQSSISGTLGSKPKGFSRKRAVTGESGFARMDIPSALVEGAGKVAKTFFSKAERMAEEKLPNVVKADSVISTLRNAGVKEEELKWIGLEDFLRGKDKVSKQDVLDFIRQNNVQVKEVTKGAKSPESQANTNALNALTEKIDRLRSQAFGPMSDGVAIPLDARSYAIGAAEGNAAAQRWIDHLPISAERKAAMLEYGKAAIESRRLNEENLMHNQRENTKFSQYQLPGAEPGSYRELLLTLPEKLDNVQWTEKPTRLNLETKGGGRQVADTKQWNANINGADYEITFNPHKSKYVLNGERGGLMNAQFNSLDEAKAYAEKGTDYKSSGRNVFRSGHFDEPNVLAHVRFNDRISPDGKKTLFIEEVQSDWHQKGRREGYANQNALRELRLKQKEQESLRAQISKLNVDDFWKALKTQNDTGPSGGSHTVSTNAMFQSAPQPLNQGETAESIYSVPVGKSITQPLHGGGNLVLDHAGEDHWRIRYKEKKSIYGADIATGSSPQEAIVNAARGTNMFPRDSAIMRAMRSALPGGFERLVDLDSNLKDEISALEIHANRQSALPPDAPFKSTWHELAMKRMLRYAAENGYDRVAWTTGDQQAARYDLSKHIDSLKWYRDGDGYRISAQKAGQIVVQKTGLSDKELADNVGKEIAEKITKNEEQHGVMSGLDLKVGGEGMKGFYDKILPDFLNKYGKKWGAKVGETQITTQPERDFKSFAQQHGRMYPDATPEQTNSAFEKNQSRTPVHSIDITPSMKHDVLYKGQPISKNEPRTIRQIFAGANA